MQLWLWPPITACMRKCPPGQTSRPVVSEARAFGGSWALRKFRIACCRKGIAETDYMQGVLKETTGQLQAVQLAAQHTKVANIPGTILATANGGKPLNENVGGMRLRLCLHACVAAARARVCFFGRASIPTYTVLE